MERLYAVTLDERYKLLRQMVWTIGGGENWSGTPYKWIGQASSWEAAKTACSNATPLNIGSVLGAAHYTQGTLVGTTYTATAVSQPYYPTSQHAASRTNYARQVSFYLTVAPVGVWSAQGDAVTNDAAYSYYVDSAIGINQTLTGATAIGSAVFPPEWCAEPSVGTDTARGWNAEPIFSIEKWNVVSSNHPHWRFR
jgi:hypothetical protein